MVMPYTSNEDLPPSVRDHLPLHAQDIFRAAFNSAYAEYSSDPRLEEIRLPRRLGSGQEALSQGWRALAASRIACLALP